MIKYYILIIAFAFISCSQTFYVVRHAEKEKQELGMSSDVALSAAGKNRAENLSNLLANKNIKQIFSTNTIRTMATAAPISNRLRLNITLYENKFDSVFIKKIKATKGNVLIVGHSNTYDDIVNLLCGRIIIMANLQDNEYDNLYEIKKRKGIIMRIENKKYGISTH